MPGDPIELRARFRARRLRLVVAFIVVPLAYVVFLVYKLAETLDGENLQGPLLVGAIVGAVALSIGWILESRCPSCGGSLSMFTRSPVACPACGAELEGQAMAHPPEVVASAPEHIRARFELLRRLKQPFTVVRYAPLGFFLVPWLAPGLGSLGGGLALLGLCMLGLAPAIETTLQWRLWRCPACRSPLPLDRKVSESSRRTRRKASLRTYVVWAHACPDCKVSFGPPRDPSELEP